MKVLVTGGAGYIGSVTTEALLARGHDVVVLDNLLTGHRAAVPAGAQFVEADVGNIDLVTSTLRQHQVEAVLHFAASSLVGESMNEPYRYFLNNTAGSLQLLAALERAEVRRFVLSSTAALFGTPDQVPISENAPIEPESVYGETKYLVERALHWLAGSAGLGYATLRYFNAAGASERFGEDHRPETHLIPLVLQVAQGKRSHVAVYGDDYPTEDGSCIRDYIHVRDLARAHILALEALEPGEERRYNLGSGQGYSVFEVIDVCRQATGKAIEAHVTGRRAGDPAVLVADSDLIGRELGWRTEFGLAAMVESAWEWYCRNPDGYAR